MRHDFIKRFAAPLLAVVCVFSFGVTGVFAASEDSATPTFKAVNYESVEELEDGGKIYTYIIDGVVNKFPVPPQDFNPLTASNEQLSTYGFPMRPTTRDAEAYSNWLELVADYDSTPVPQIEVMDGPISRPMEQVGDISTRAVSSYSSNWSGYMSNLGTSSSNCYTQVQGDYIQPTIASISGASNANVVGYWVGLGGSNQNRPLVQAGTATTGKSDYWAWYEYLSPKHLNPAIRITSLAIHPGDRIHVYISFQKANDKFNYYIANNTTGKSASGIVEIDGDEYFDGSTAEWITERASSKLSNFGSITMTNCKATLNTSNTWKNLNSLSGINKITLTSNGSSSGTKLCIPGSITSNNNFTSTWKAFS